MSVLVQGALHWDVVVDAPRLPYQGETLTGTAVDYRFGGKGGNQAVAAAQMGARVHMAGRVGMDAEANRILAVLDRAGVGRDLVLAEPGRTGMSVAITDPGGDYGAVIVAGANALNDGMMPAPADVTHCLIQSEIPERANLTLAERLPEDVTLILNAAPARSVSEALLARVDILIVNRIEAEQLSGIDAPTGAARFLRGLGIGAVIVTLGDQGAILADAEGDIRLDAHRVSTVSSHGAGDMFAGALAARLAGGDDLREAMPFANGAAALFVSLQVGARDQLDAEDVATFLEH